MSVERLNQSIENLESQQHKLKGLIGQRKDLNGRLQDERGKLKVGQPGLENVVIDIRAGRLDTASSHAEISIQRRENLLLNIEQQLEEARNRDPQRMELARDHIDQVRIFEELVKDLKTLEARGRIPKNVLNLRINELRALKAKPAQDPELKRGIELLKEAEEKRNKTKEIKTEEPQSKPEAKEELSRILVDSENHELTIDGKKVRFYANTLEWQIVTRLLENANRTIPTKKLNKLAKKSGSKAKFPVGNSISHLRTKVEADPKNPKIIVSSGYSRSAGYRINANVEFVGEKVEKAEPGEKAEKRGFPELIESRKHALEYFFLGLATTKDVITILGPSKATGRNLTRPQAMFALGRCVNLLYAKIKRDLATEEEKGLWNLVKTYTRTTEKTDRETWKDTFDTIKEWFGKDHPLSEKEISQIDEIEREKVKPLTDEEAAILAFAIDANRELLKKAGLVEIDPQVAKGLFSKIKDRIRIDKEKLTETRKGIFEKVEKLIESDALYELIDLESPEALKLLDYLTSTDSIKLLEFLKIWLSGGNLDELIDKFNHERNGNGHQEPPVKTVKTKKRETEEKYHTIEELAKETGLPMKILQDRISRLIKKDKTIKPERLEKGKTRKLFFKESDFEKIKAQVSSPVREKREEKKPVVEAEKVTEEPVLPKPEKPEGKKFSYPIEAQDSEIRKKINEYLDKVEATGLESFTGASLTRFFQRLKMSIQKTYREKGWIKPDSGRDGSHPRFTRQDVAAMQYIYDFKNGMSKNLARQVYKIIKEEDEKREKKKNNKNGK